MMVAAAAPPLANAEAINFVTTLGGFNTPPDACSSGVFRCDDSLLFTSMIGGQLIADGSRTHTVQGSLGLGTSGTVIAGSPFLGGINRIELTNTNESITLTFANVVTLVSASFNNTNEGNDPFDGTSEMLNISNGTTTINPVLMSSIGVGLTGTSFTFSRRAGDGADFYLAGIDVAPVPEPSTWALLGLGLLGMGYMARRRTKA